MASPLPHRHPAMPRHPVILSVNEGSFAHAQDDSAAVGTHPMPDKLVLRGSWCILYVQQTSKEYGGTSMTVMKGKTRQQEKEHQRVFERWR